MTNVDTPDYQAGLVSAQKLLLAVPANTNDVQVGIPPNAETLIIVAPSATPDNFVEVFGTTSQTDYVGGQLLPGGSSIGSGTYVFDVSSAVDPTVSVTFSDTLTQPWWIYSDAGVHVTADLSKLTNAQGMTYVIPSAPGPYSGDHPPNELQVESFDNVGNATHVLGTILGGRRYRIFYATLCLVSAGNSGNLSDTINGTPIIWARSISDVAPTMVDYKPSGLALPTGAGLSFNTYGPAGTGTIVYTIETV